MKYSCLLFLIGISLFFFICPKQFWAMEESSKQSLNEVLDLTTIKIESPAAREILKKEYIKVRKGRTEYLPSGEVPVLEFEPLKDDESKMKKLKWPVISILPR
jgi:hypothetical protein